MRIGLTGGGSTTERVIQQAQRAEADGFSALWYASEVCGDPLVAMALAGRETKTIELGTAVLQTYPCHHYYKSNGSPPSSTPWPARIHPRDRPLTRAVDPQRVRAAL